MDVPLGPFIPNAAEGVDALRIIIGGALGRMGRELAAAAETAGVAVALGVDVAYQGQEWSFPMTTSYDEARTQADVLIDFSKPNALGSLLNFCEMHCLPAVLCATGYTAEELMRMEGAARTIPLLRSANMSLGINVMEQLVAMAAVALGDQFDIEIVEKHHRMKADSPSGTALQLYESVKKQLAGGVKPAYGHFGRARLREEGDVGLHAVRGGTISGEHEVGFYGEGEQLLLTHRAENRAIFSRGALAAARFLLGKPAGLYSMGDVVAKMLESV